METTDLLFALLRHAVCGKELNTEIVHACTPEKLEEVYVLAQKHDIAHLVAHALEAADLPACDALVKLKKAKITAIYRYAKQDYEFTRACGALDAARIPFIPLKGSVLRQYYPEPWMRTSCDIDILVKKSNLNHAISILTSTLQCSCGVRSDYDIPLHAPSGTHLELHYNIPMDRYASLQRQEVLKISGKMQNQHQKTLHGIFCRMKCFIFTIYLTWQSI